jgi:succinoglycan biosynthesis transport protein ExoP
MTDAPNRSSSSKLPAGQMADNASVSEVFRQTLAFFRRHLWLILLVGFSFAALAVVVTQKMERLYKSSVQLMIEPPAQSPIEAETATFATTDTGYVDGQILLIEADDTLIRVVESGNLKEKKYFQAVPANIVLKSVSKVKNFILGPSTNDRSAPDGAPDRKTLNAKNILAEMLSVEREGDTNVISIGMRANSPALAQTTATLVAQTYVDIRLGQRQQDAREFSDWINARADVLREQVTQAEEAVTAYRIENSLFNAEGDASLNDQQMTEFNTELIRSSADLAQKKAALGRASNILDNGGDVRSIPEAQASEIITELRNQLLLLELRERDLSTASEQTNPRLSQVRQQYEATAKQLNSEIVRIVATLANEVETLESRTRLLTEALSDAGQQSTIETQINVGLRQLERVAEAYRQHYQRYLENAGLAAELKSFTTSGTQVITSATVPINPYYPTVKVFVILSFMLGAALAVVMGLAREALDMTFRSAQQVEAILGVEVLAQIPNLKSGTDIPAIVENDPLSIFSETISVLRFMLFSTSSDGDRAPIFLLTSNASGEGKTSIAASLAVSASNAGQNVLLIDADMRRPGLTAKFGLEDEIGFADIIQGSPWKAPDIVGEGVFDVLPVGILSDMPLTALESPNLPKFLELARQSYDLVVIDGPPVAYIADCTILSNYSDHLLLVVRWGQTLRDQAARGFQRLPKSKVSGAVLNGCPLSEEIGLGSTYKLHDRPVHRRAKIFSTSGRAAAVVPLLSEVRDRRA